MLMSERYSRGKSGRAQASHRRSEVNRSLEGSREGGSKKAFSGRSTSSLSSPMAGGAPRRSLLGRVDEVNPGKPGSRPQPASFVVVDGVPVALAIEAEDTSKDLAGIGLFRAGHLFRRTLRDNAPAAFPAFRP